MIGRLCDVISLVLAILVLVVGGAAVGLGAPLWALIYIFTGFNPFRFWMETIDMLADV